MDGGCGLSGAWRIPHGQRVEVRLAFDSESNVPCGGCTAVSLNGGGFEPVACAGQRLAFNATSDASKGLEWRLR